MVPQYFLQRNEEAHGARVGAGANILPEQEEAPAIMVEKQMKSVKSRRRQRLRRELDERSSFMEYLRNQRENYDFELAERQYLYGNDL